MKIVLFVSILIDLILDVLLPQSVLSNHITIVPSVYLIALIVTQRNYSKMNNFITTIGYTVLYCTVMNLPVISTLVFYLCVVFISRIWSKNVLDSVLELTILCTSIVFIKEVFGQMMVVFSYRGKIDIQNLVIYKITPSIIFAALCSFLFIIIYRACLDHLRIKAVLGSGDDKLYKIDYFKKK